MLSTIAADPKTRIIPPIIEPAIAHEILPVIQPNPRKTTAIIATILAHVPVSKSSKALRKLVMEPKSAPPEPPPVACASAESDITQIVSRKIKARFL